MTRAEALNKAREWAVSATNCYRRAYQAHDDARLLDIDRPPVAIASPEVRRLTALADAEYRGAEIETALAAVWAAIAAATPEEPQP